MMMPGMGKPAPISQAMFNKYKKDGRMGEPEFKNLAYDLGNHLSDGEVTMALKMIDKDGDGTVDYEEFVQWWRQEDRWGKLQLDEAQLQKLQNAAKYFRYWDKDGGGSIDREEFKGLHADLVKRGLTDKDLDRCLEDLDENRDGEIQFNEYVDWLVRLGAIPIKTFMATN